MTIKTMPPNFNEGWKYIPGASKFEINKEGTVRQCGNKQIVNPKDDIVRLWSDEKKLDEFNPKEIALELFGNKPESPEQVSEPETETNQNQQNTMAKKVTPAKKTKAAKKEKVVKAELKLNATQQKLVDNKELSKSEKIRSLAKDGLSQPHIAQALKLDHPQMVWNVLNAKPKAKKEKKAKAAKAPKKKAEKKVTKKKPVSKNKESASEGEPSKEDLESLGAISKEELEETLDNQEEGEEDRGEEDRGEAGE